jgi:phenylacetate-coenzyme A ligase PaaK-like adenylate-forming protein
MRPLNLQPTPRARESLARLLGDLVRLPWVRLDATHYLEDYLASQWLAPSALGELQRAKLRRLTWHCFLHVPYFRARLGAVLSPAEIERLDGPSRLPLVGLAERGDDTAFVADAETRVEESAERRAAVRMRAERWGAPPSRWFAPRRLGVVAAPCERGAAHVSADHLLVEIVDAEGCPLAPGAPGRVVVTDLHQYQRPYLRQEIAARGRLLPRACTCGRPLPLFEPAPA